MKQFYCGGWQGQLVGTAACQGEASEASLDSAVVAGALAALAALPGLD